MPPVAKTVMRGLVACASTSEAATVVAPSARRAIADGIAAGTSKATPADFEQQAPEKPAEDEKPAEEEAPTAEEVAEAPESEVIAPTETVEEEPQPEPEPVAEGAE